MPASWLVMAAASLQLDLDVKMKHLSLLKPNASFYLGEGVEQAEIASTLVGDGSSKFAAST